LYVISNFKVFAKPVVFQKGRFSQEFNLAINCIYRGADKSLAQPGRKQATATEDF
jgi:hypothetical protein